MINYIEKNYNRKAMEQSDVYVKDMGSGLFLIEKSRHGKRGKLMDASAVVQMFNNGEHKTSIEKENIIVSNYELFGIKENKPKSSVKFLPKSMLDL